MTHYSVCARACVRVCVCVSFQHRNNLTEFHETWHECHVTEATKTP